ncbi:MAG TPA: CpaD family pilus assembly protein, partial [Rhizomicrobium sp.]|nr:CpaD family pilus assembly protein [Rhizomicrobium sp.]
MTGMKDFFRFGAIAAVLLAGSCAAPINNANVTADGEANHPISVAPSYQSIKVSFSAENPGLLPDDSAKLDAFVGEYVARGNGAISVSVPAGPGAAASIHYFGERLADMGVARANILVGTHEVTGKDGRVELGYVGYVAHTDPCGDWSQDASDTATNLPMPDFGCSVQHDIAAMVADPRDLVAERPIGTVDATRRS